MLAKAGIQVFSGFPPEVCGNDVTGLRTHYYRGCTKHSLGFATLHPTYVSAERLKTSFCWLPGSSLGTSAGHHCAFLDSLPGRPLRSVHWRLLHSSRFENIALLGSISQRDATSRLSWKPLPNIVDGAKSSPVVLTIEHPSARSSIHWKVDSLSTSKLMIRVNGLHHFKHPDLTLHRPGSVFQPTAA